MDNTETNELRDRLRSVMRKSPASARAIAAAMGISHVTFMKFYNGSKPNDLKSLLKIECWVEKREKSNE